jgi:cytochrome c oxidase subunit III
MSDAIFPVRPRLAIGSIGARSSGFWGIVFLVISEASLFFYLFFSYFYVAIQPHAGPWPPGGPPELKYAIIQSVMVLIGSGTAWWANRSAALGENLMLLIGLAATLVLGLAFIGVQLLDWYKEPFSFQTDPFSSLYFVIGGIHLIHFAVGVIMVAAVLLWSALGYFGPVRHAPVTITAFYWYFVTVAWFGVFFTLYITPYLG